MSRQEQIAAVLLGAMVVLAVLTGLWSRRVRGPLRHAPEGQATVGRGMRHGLGCVAFALVGVPIFALVPMLALIPSGVFVVIALQRFGRSGPSDRSVGGISVLCAVVWLAYWAYETQLNVWMATV